MTDDDTFVDVLGRVRRRPNWTPDMRRDAAIAGRIGGLRRAGRRSPFDLARDGAAGQDGLLAQFEAEADPNGVLDQRQRRVRAERLMRAHMIDLGRKSRRTRKRTTGPSGPVVDQRRTATRQVKERRDGP